MLEILNHFDLSIHQSLNSLIVMSSNSMLTDLRSFLDLTNLRNPLCTALSNINLNVGFEIVDVVQLILLVARCSMFLLQN